MKTSRNFDMEAPNKLFIKPEKIKVEMIPGGELPNVGIQYIRKDLLLEWAEGKKKYYLDRQEYDCGWNDLLDEVIDKLNSL